LLSEQLLTSPDDLAIQSISQEEIDYFRLLIKEPTNILLAMKKAEENASRTTGTERLVLLRLFYFP
jgi:hypothetical protein